MGKDNIEPHTLLWPGMLIGSNLGYSLPHTIYAYEFLTWHNQKFSKSRHIGMNLEEALEAMPGEYWRFALASILPETADTDFNIEVLQQSINNELNDIIGNFVHRTLTLVKNSFSSRVPKQGESLDVKNVLAKADGYVKEYLSYFDNIQMREALHSLVSMAALGNEFLSKEEPWKLIKQGKQKRAEEVVGACTSIVEKILLFPFMPESSKKICGLLGIEPELSFLNEDLSGKELKLESLAPLFSKLTTEQIKKIASFS